MLVLDGSIRGSGKFWKIEKIADEHYVLTIGNNFYASSDSLVKLLDELDAYI